MGAWDFGAYKRGMDGRNDARLGVAIMSIKKELIYNGFDTGIVLDLPYFGDAVANRTKDFQTAHSLPVDGAVGSKTAIELYRKRVGDLEGKYRLPTAALGKLIKLESLYDPAARGVVDPLDTGISQINLSAHPDVTEDQAYDSSFALDWTCRHIVGSFNNIAKNVDVIKAARAAYNIGDTYAAQWLESGFAASGGPLLGGEDSFSRATNYISVIDKQTY